MGILYIVPTPVGNMEDMTMRAIRILKEADLVLAEDTRTSGILLQHFDIKNRLMSHHKFNEHGTTASVVERLKAGETIALISDAGTPGISDPGFFLAREAAKAGITVQCLPGATAFVPAIVSSGLPCDRFCFEGFLPQKKGRQTLLQSLQTETRTMIFYESPYRLVKTLEQFAEFFGEDRQASVCREISKLHEESVRGTLAEIIDHFKQTEPRGEIVVVVAGCAGVDISARKALKEQAKEKKPKLSNKERYAMREAAPAEFRNSETNNKKQNDMKKLSLVLLSVVLLSVTSCDLISKSKEGNAPNVEQTDSLQRIISQKDNEINDMMETFNQIQIGLREIGEAENRVTVAQTGEGASSRKQMLEDVRFISSTMQQNRALLEKLRQQLRESSIKGDQLRRTIDELVAQINDKEQQLQQLRAELDAKNIHIADLDKTITGLNDNVSSLQEESSKKTETINDQDAQLNTAWFAFGTKRELKDQRIIDGSKVLQSNFNKSYFTKIDIRVQKEIKLYSKSAKILTMHPSSSYTLQQDANKQYVLRISNPQIFWSTSKYLVIQVKK